MELYCVVYKLSNKIFESIFDESRCPIFFNENAAWLYITYRPYIIQEMLTVKKIRMEDYVKHV